MKNRSGSAFIAAVTLAGAIVSLVVPTSALAEVAPQTKTFHRDYITSDLVTNKEYGFMIYADEDGHPGYQADVTTEAPKTLEYVLTDELDPKLQYVLTSKQTGQTEANDYIYQACIWWCRTGDQMADYFKNANDTDIYGLLDKHIVPTVQAANEYARNGDVRTQQAAAAISIPDQPDKFNESDAESGWYESNLITVTTADGGQYTVSCDIDGARVVDSTYYSHGKFNSGDAFRVLVPQDSLSGIEKADVTVSEDTQAETARLYRPQNDADAELYGPMVTLVNEDVTLERNLSFGIPADKKAAFDNAMLYSAIGIAMVAVVGVLLLVAYLRRDKRRRA